MKVDPTVDSPESGERPEIRVLCVDDDDLVGQLIKITLKHAGGFQWLGQAHEADDLVARVLQDRPDVVLLDLCMPGKSPFTAIEELITACPDVKVIMLSGHADSHLIDRAIEAGAWGYLSKFDDGADLVCAIRRIAGGEFVLGPQAKTEYARA
ncbi:MAG: response regulator transcription factor [Phycisphaerales bacterium]|nr:response regulator transcription factor [Phycisphaerales bacterium]MCI0677170.1 response regulator transcription factor [Phycisphaerales bacterium]